MFTKCFTHLLLSVLSLFRDILLTSSNSINGIFKCKKQYAFKALSLVLTFEENFKEIIFHI